MTEIVIEQDKELEQKSTELTVQAKQLSKIGHPEDYRKACDLGLSLKTMLNGIEEFWADKISAAFKTHKMLVKAKNDMTAPVEAAMVTVKRLIAAFEAEQEQSRREAERAAAEALRKQEEERAMREAELLQNAGNAQGAASVIEQAISAPAPVVVVQSNVPQVAGKSSRGIWKWRLKDASKLKPQYLIPDEQAIGQVVRALKDKAISAIGEGSIEVYEEKSVAFRS
jgi:hypothetical protein